MLAWLKSLITARADAERWKAEVESLRLQVEKLEKKLDAADARFIREIAGNRKREDGYKDLILRLKGVTGNQLPPERNTEIENQSSSETVEESTPTAFTYADEEAIRARAKQFYEQAIERGIEDVNFEDYVAIIRADPVKYLDN